MKQNLNNVVNPSTQKGAMNMANTTAAMTAGPAKDTAAKAAFKLSERMADWLVVTAVLSMALGFYLGAVNILFFFIGGGLGLIVFLVFILEAYINRY